MHPIIEKSVEVKNSLGLNLKDTAKHIGVSKSAYASWVRDETPPRKQSLEKVQKFIERAEAGETFKPKPKQRPTMIRKIERKESKLMYAYIHYLENKYDDLENVDEEDPMYKLLREQTNDS